MKNATQLLATFPDDLQAAVQSSISDADIPKQGNALLRYVASCELRGEELSEMFLSDAANAIDDWISSQYGLQHVARSILELLNKVEPIGQETYFPEWRAANWSQTLMMPWSEGLLDSIVQAMAYIKKNA